MPENKPLTGYPSIDKPHLKYYRDVPVRNIKVEQTIYQMVFEENRNNLDLPALRYMSKTWSFGALQKKVDAAAKAFYGAGLRTGDVVLIGLPNIPEATVCLLALNKIGAVSKWFDIRAGEKDITEYLEDGKCRFAVVFDMLLPIMKNVTRHVSLSRVLVVSPVDSLPWMIRAGYKLKSGKSFVGITGMFQRFNDFVREYKSYDHAPMATFDASRPSIMVQSSGTTGKPKVIVHSDYAATTSVHKHAFFDLPLGTGKVLLNTLPPWIIYGICEGLLYPFALGTEVILHPAMEDDTLVKYMGKFTIAMAIPLHYRYLCENFDKINVGKRQKFLERVECLCSGGDKLSVEESKTFEEKFHAPLVNGWGNNEAFADLTCNPAKHTRYGSVGIPKYTETIIAYDNDRQEELPYNQVGELCVLTDTMLLKYENNEEETQKVKRTHSDGKIWLHTGDLGYIDEDGFVFLAGRLRRVIIRQGFKISAYTIEDAISEHPAVKECVAVEVEDAEEEHAPMAFVTLKDSAADKARAEKELLQYAQGRMKAYEVPKHLRVVDELPYTQNGKYDFRLLETMGNEWVKTMRKEETV